MPFISWNEDVIVGVKKIDAQHKEFLEILNKLYSLRNSENTEAQKETMLKLEKHLKEHFKTELDLMIEYKDPGYFSHKLEHERMENKVRQQVRKFLKNPGTIDSEFLEDLKRWFINHLDFNDKKLARHILSTRM